MEIAIGQTRLDSKTTPSLVDRLDPKTGSSLAAHVANLPELRLSGDKFW